ncbi:hypothetical protein LOK49_LG02G02430 [Camellia lanceoleosa]|uniref:Uncharacterized protein n=2 Tax=Camellia lanceoleosa TaxID=1840588 RepID=A0ACC0ITJ8_9ERIC|nr:hypothetical protein LOK49_LG02G02434 [Camellia lanceoleosa]KAI8028261.1 hypothetical protein LOK49_LG02G02430 [Camellia lanceoleosa]
MIRFQRSRRSNLRPPLPHRLRKVQIYNCRSSSVSCDSSRDHDLSSIVHNTIDRGIFGRTMMEMIGG